MNLVQCPICFGCLRRDADSTFRCGSCAATYPSAGNVPDFLGGTYDGADEIEVDYDYHLRRRAGALYHVYNRIRRLWEYQLIEREADHLGRRLDLLDIGSSDPTRPKSYHAQVLKLARHYIGIEPSRTITPRVRPSSSVGVVRANGELRVIKDQTIDMALCFGTLDRCVDPSRVLSNMAAALRPGGCVMIDLPNKDVWYRTAYDRWRRMLAWCSTPAERRQLRRRWKLTPNTLERQLEAAGFEDIKLYSLLYLSSLVRSHAFNPVVGLLGEQRCAASLRQVDRIGRSIAPRRGGMFIITARKPNDQPSKTKPL